MQFDSEPMDKFSTDYPKIFFPTKHPVYFAADTAMHGLTPRPTGLRDQLYFFLIR